MFSKSKDKNKSIFRLAVKEVREDIFKAERSNPRQKFGSVQRNKEN